MRFLHHHLLLFTVQAPASAVDQPLLKIALYLKQETCIAGMMGGIICACVRGGGSAVEISLVYDVVIVGGGPAGLAAGLYCQRAAVKTVLFEKGLIGGQIAISKEVENYPGVEGITGFDLAEKLQHHAKGFGLQIIQEEVVAIKAGPDLHAVQLANGDLYRTAAVILAPVVS
jgi:alkyl hydroperoxide reductase subunit AhpF